MDEAKVLSVDPLYGDFGCPGDRVISDKMVTARKETECGICGGLTIKGSRIRVRTEIFDGCLESARLCNSCCEAMEMSHDDGGEALSARWELMAVAGKDGVNV